MKEECLWINEFDNLNNLIKSLKSWFNDYNQNYLHSKLHYKSPIEFKAEFKQSFAENTLLNLHWKLGGVTERKAGAFKSDCREKDSALMLLSEVEKLLNN